MSTAGAPVAQPARAQLAPAVQRRAFSTIFLIEMWERFGFYGMQVLLVTYMIKKLGFVDTRANLTWGAAAALIYATPAIGGWIGDKVLGNRRTLLIGAGILTLGYALLWWPNDNEYYLYFALGIIIVGNGLFKPNCGNMVRRIYDGDDTRIDSAFTMYYMAVNIGSMFSMTITPWVRNYIGAHFSDTLGWHTAFGVCAVGLTFGLLNFLVMRRTIRAIGSPPDALPAPPRRVLAVLGGAVVVAILSGLILQSRPVARLCVYAAAAVVLGIFVHLIRSSERHERDGLIAALLLVLQTVCFFIFYQQMSTSLNLFAQRNVDLDFRIFGHHVLTWIPEQYQNLNSIWIVVLSPVLVGIYNGLGRLGRDPPIALKFACGFAACAIGFYIYGVSAVWAVHGQVSSWAMIWGYGLYSLGELLVSGLGLAMIARYVPVRMGGFMMGAYFVASGISQYLGSMVANIAHIPEDLHDPVQSLAIYTNLFNRLGLAGIGCTALSLAMLPLLRRLSDSHHAHAAQAVHAEPPAAIAGTEDIGTAS